MAKMGKWAVAGVVVLGVAAGLGFGVFEIQTAFFDDEVRETLSTEGDEIASGAFHDVAHAVKGRARVMRGADGAHELQLVDFHVDNGPTLEVWLVALDDATDDASIETAEHVVVGPLKGNIGDQAYALPAAYDPGRHRAAVVWCERFGVNFATAPLRVVE